jgi:hypothetical protein
MLRSTSRLSQCKPPPRPRISAARTSRRAARLSSGISFTGKAIASPFLSSIRNACSRGRYATNLTRASVLAAHLPAQDARTKLERSSFCIHRGIVRDLDI